MTGVLATRMSGGAQAPPVPQTNSRDTFENCKQKSQAYSRSLEWFYPKKLIKKFETYCKGKNKESKPGPGQNLRNF